MKTNQSKQKIIQKYNVNFDKATWDILAHSFVDYLVMIQKENSKKFDKQIIEPKKEDKNNLALLINLFNEFIFENDLNDIIKNKIERIKKDFKEWKITALLLRDLIFLFFDLNFTDFFTFLIEKYENQAIKYLKIITKIWSVIPIGKFSIQEILCKKYESIIKDTNNEIDNYDNLNQSITSLIFSSIPAIVWLFAINNFPEKFHDFFYWFIVILLLVFLFFLVNFIKNIFEKEKRKHLLFALDGFILAFDDSNNINEDYLDYVKFFIKEIQIFEKSDANKIEYESRKKSLRLWMHFKRWETLSLYLKSLWYFLTWNKLKISLIFIFILLAYLFQNEIIKVITM